MPYSNPSSPAAVEQVSSTPAPFSFSHRAIHRSHHAYPHHPHDHSTGHHSSGSSSPSTWSSPASGPMPSIPRRASSTSSSSRTGVISPPSTLGMVLPRRGSRDKSPGATPPRRGTPAEGESSLGLSVGEAASSSSSATSDGTALTTPAPRLVSSSSTAPPAIAFPTAPSPSPPLPSPPFRRTNSPSMAERRNGSPSLKVDIPPPKPQHPLQHHARHHSHIGSSNSSSVRPAPPPRKKSGELVKPSLKSRTSYSTPNSAGPEDEEEEGSEDRWTTSRSAPATPSGESRFGSERKTLRFAGGHGDEGELERVVLFKREHKVTAVTRVLEGEDLDRVTDTETEGEGGAKSVFGNVWASPKYSRSPSATSSGGAERERIQIHQSESSTVPRIPGLNFENGRGRPILVPEYDQVVLESINLVDEGGPAGALTLKGTVVVKDITYSKWVTIRFTFDDWQTVSEVSAVHTVHIPSSTLGPKYASGPGWDRFSFSVKLDDVRRKIDERHLYLAVRYSIEGGAEWWDSNMGSNFRVRFKKVKQVAAPAPVTKPKSDNGGAFLPLLEAKTHHHVASPMSYHSHSSRNANTHLPLPSRLPSALHTHNSAIQSQPWTFPHRASELEAYSNSSPRSTTVSLSNASPVRPKAGLSTSFSLTSPVKLKNHCYSTSPPLSPPKPTTSIESQPTQVQFGKLAAVAGGGSGSLSPSRPAGHTRTKSSLSFGGGADHGFLSQPAYMRPTQPSFPPLSSSPSKRSSAVAMPSSSAPRSPPFAGVNSPPSPTESLPATPLPNSAEISPRVMTLALSDTGSEASSSGRKQKEDVSSDSYADFIARYCFYNGSDALSPPSSASTSPLDRPASLPVSMQSLSSPPDSTLSSGQSTPQQGSPLGLAQTLSFLPPAWSPTPSSLPDRSTTPTGRSSSGGGIFWGTVATSSPRRSPPPAAASEGGRVISV